MNNAKNYIILVLFLSVNLFAQAQKGITTFGIQYKPIVPNRIIGTYNQQFNIDNFESSIQQKVGHSFAMIIRKGITNTLSFETGLSFTKRNFDLNFAVPDSSLVGQGQVSFVGYEIPVKGLVFIRLGENTFMNTAFGASFNYFPSDVTVNIPLKNNEYFLQEGARLNRVQGAVLVDIGFEYRTRRKGYFYLGSSYNLPFTEIVTFAMSYEYQGGKSVVLDNIRGSYITLDFRYYFNENPDKKLKN